MILRLIINKLRTPLKGCGNILVSPKLRFVPQLLLAYCATDVQKTTIEISPPESLSHKFLLKQSAGAAVSAVTQLLHQTVSAYVDIAAQYIKVLDKQMSLTEEFLSKIGDLYAEQQLSDSLIECRAEVKRYKEEFTEIESLVLYIEDLVNSTTQTSFLAGAEYHALALTEQLISAKREIQRTKQNVEQTELLYLQVEKEAIEKERKD